MSKQTAVEWLVEQLNSSAPISRYGHEHISISMPKELIDQAKAMEREQIIIAFCEGYDHDGESYDDAETKYYNSTYKGGDQ